MPLKTIVTDIDGCLIAGRGKLIDMDVFKELHELREEVSRDTQSPWMAVVTARPQPYLEAILQMIDEAGIGLFEWGCGLFQLREYRHLYHPALNVSLLEKIAHCKARLTRYLEEEKIGFLQPGKEVAMTIYPIGFNPEAIESLYQEVSQFVKSEDPILYQELEIKKIRRFVNILPKGINKQSGLVWLTEEIGLDLECCLGIGDNEDDLPFLKVCGISAAPSSAAQSVKNEVDYCSPFSYGQGLIDCIRQYL